MKAKKEIPVAPPVAEKKLKTFTIHGDKRVDEYAWLKAKEDPKVIEYLRTENAYADAYMVPRKKLQSELYKEMRARMKEDDMSVPVKDGPYYYYSRTMKGKQYAIHCRRYGLRGKEEIILDENILAKGRKFFNLGSTSVSPNHILLAYTTDTTGDECYVLYVKNLKTGKLLGERIEMAGNVEWADNENFFYTIERHPHPPHKALRHTLHTDTALDLCVYDEADPQYFVSLDKSCDEKYIFIYASSFDTTEVRLIPTAQFENAPRLLRKRKKSVRYYAEHHEGSLYITTNEEAVNFKVLRTPLASAEKSTWTVWLPERTDRSIFDFAVYKSFFVLNARERGTEEAIIIDPTTRVEKIIKFEEAEHTIHVWGDEEYDTSSIRITYQSFISPRTVYDYDIAKSTLTIRKRQRVPGWDKRGYVSKRVWVENDGVRIPVTLAYRKDLDPRASASNKRERPPLMIEAYGSYGICSDPVFSITRVSLLKRGWIIAEAHPRGGGEMGWQWHNDAKLLTKHKTYEDVIACIDALVDKKYTTREKIALVGGSAGGMMVGAVFNMRPDICGMGIAYVPAADLITSSLDESLGGTRLHYDETGDPRIRKQYFYLKKTSPYENVRATRYPALLVRASLFDNRTPYWEAAKWVARLRAKKTDTNPLLFKVEMNAGHFGKTGRYEWLKERAFDFAFLIFQTSEAHR